MAWGEGAMSRTLAHWRSNYNGCKLTLVEGSAPSPTGLRAFKKARTREAISDVATWLFVQRGFEAVTMAEIAQAAEVSVKTIFNHFNSKEELFFDRADDVLGALVDAILERTEGVPTVEA